MTVGQGADEAVAECARSKVLEATWRFQLGRKDPRRGVRCRSAGTGKTAGRAGWRRGVLFSPCRVLTRRRCRRGGCQTGPGDCSNKRIQAPDTCLWTRETADRRHRGRGARGGHGRGGSRRSTAVVDRKTASTFAGGDPDRSPPTGLEISIRRSCAPVASNQAPRGAADLAGRRQSPGSARQRRSRLGEKLLNSTSGQADARVHWRGHWPTLLTMAASPARRNLATIGSSGSETGHRQGAGRPERKTLREERKRQAVTA